MQTDREMIQVGRKSLPFKSALESHPHALVRLCWVTGLSRGHCIVMYYKVCLSSVWCTLHLTGQDFSCDCLAFFKLMWRWKLGSFKDTHIYITHSQTACSDLFLFIPSYWRSPAVCDLEEEYIYSTLCNDVDRPDPLGLVAQHAWCVSAEVLLFLFSFSSHWRASDDLNKREWKRDDVWRDGEEINWRIPIWCSVLSLKPSHFRGVCLLGSCGISL